jgi:flavin reductase (DIM6/NTAB) family NADH-FMN oxidoreductase RutF
MFYETETNQHGMKYDPFKALLVPRPIGWVSTISDDGVVNIAPYSFFNAVSDKPPYVVFSSFGIKDSLKNINQNGEFVCSLANWDLRYEMNTTSAAVPYGVDEFALAGLTATASRLVKPPRVKNAPAAFECKLWQTIDLPSDSDEKPSTFTMIIGRVVGIHIDDQYLKDGRVDTGAMRPIARLGYMDYGVINPENVFTINRPEVDPDGKVANARPEGGWDGQYR